MSSKIPTDSATPDMGSQFLLDSFDFDEDYNGGVLEGARLPEAYGLSGLPDGLVAESSDFEVGAEKSLQEGMDLSELDMDGSADLFEEGMDLAVRGVFATSGLPGSVDIPDGDMEDSTRIVDHSWLVDTVQDPKRLPTTPADRMIPELVQAWGTRTDGISRIEMRDLDDARYHENVVSVEKSASVDDLKWVMARAMRRSARGDSLAQIKQEIVETLGHDAQKLASAVALLEQEHGLHGKVFLRASAFPGLLRGKWAKQIRKSFKHVRYLIACGSCDACRSGCPKDCACNAQLGFQAVASVPWKKAYAHYAPRLKLTGQLTRVASSKLSKKEALRQAFLTSPKNSAPREETLFPTHVAPADTISLKEARKQLSAAQVEQERVDAEALATEKLRKKAHAKIQGWKKAGLLSTEESGKLLAFPGDPRRLLRFASKIIASKTSKSEYEGQGLGKMPQLASKKQAQKELKQASESLKKATAEQQDMLKRYGGETHKQAQQLFTWIRRQMSEGVMGKELDQLVRLRFAKDLRTAAKSDLVQIRRKHEGLSGTLYVDAEAYASKTGASGCDAGALRHRANAVPTVLAMPRCSSCVFKNADNVCQKYNKPLVDSAPVADPAKYQKEQLRLANASDAEITASLFSNPSLEFGLHNDLLDEVDLWAAPETEKLAAFTFGGMEWNDDD